MGTGVPAPPHPSRVPSGFTLHRPHAHPREAGWGATLSTPTQASGLSWGYAGLPPSPGPGVRRVPAVAPCGEGRQAAHVLGGSPCPGRCRRVAGRARPGHLGSEAERAQWAAARGPRAQAGVTGGCGRRCTTWRARTRCGRPGTRAWGSERLASPPRGDAGPAQAVGTEPRPPSSAGDSQRAVRPRARGFRRPIRAT